MCVQYEVMRMQSCGKKFSASFSFHQIHFGKRQIPERSLSWFSPHQFHVAETRQDDFAFGLKNIEIFRARCRADARLHSDFVDRHSLFRNRRKNPFFDIHGYLKRNMTYRNI